MRIVLCYNSCIQRGVLMGFFEKLFCKHNFVCYRNGPDANGFLSSFWVCTKCDKKHSKRGQAEVHASFIPGRNAPAYVSRPRNATAPSTDLLNPLNPFSPLNPANTVSDECDNRRKYDYFGSSRGVVVDDVGRPVSCATRYDDSPSSSCSSSSSSSYDNDSSSSSCSSSSSDY